jgi:hypothetical protein
MTGTAVARKPVRLPFRAPESGTALTMLPRMLHYFSCAIASLSLRSSNSRVSKVNRAPSRRRVRSRGSGYLHARQVRTALLSLDLIREKLTIFALLHFLQAPGGAVGGLFAALNVLIFRTSFDVDLGTQAPQDGHWTSSVDPRAGASFHVTLRA